MSSRPGSAHSDALFHDFHILSLDLFLLKTPCPGVHEVLSTLGVHIISWKWRDRRLTTVDRQARRAAPQASACSSAAFLRSTGSTNLTSTRRAWLTTIQRRRLACQRPQQREILRLRADLVQ